jgi:hypothetical protein
MYSSDKERPGGQPSTTQPRALPCDSPKVVTLNRVPNVFPAIIMFVFVPVFKLHINSKTNSVKTFQAVFKISFLLMLLSEKSL